MNEDMVPQKVLDETRALLLYYQDGFYKLLKAQTEQEKAGCVINFTENELIILMDELDFIHSTETVTYPQAIVQAVNAVIKRRVKQ